jgi:hypothetical protein
MPLAPLAPNINKYITLSMMLETQSMKQIHSLLCMTPFKFWSSAYHYVHLTLWLTYQSPRHSQYLTISYMAPCRVLFLSTLWCGSLLYGHYMAWHNVFWIQRVQDVTLQGLVRTLPCTIQMKERQYRQECLVC